MRNVAQARTRTSTRQEVTAELGAWLAEPRTNDEIRARVARATRA